MGHFYFGRPSNKLVVIGVTGTNGKTTTVNLLARILQAGGFKVGYTSTATMNIDGAEWLNDMKMTMPSGWLLHKWLKRMLKYGCQYAILEVSSEGLAQNRHLGINFDVAVFTNLTPEHLEAHGGFENYKHAKAELFKVISKNRLTQAKQKLNPQLQKTIIVNADDKYGQFYASFKADRHVSFGINNQRADFVASGIQYSPQGIEFKIYNLEFKLHLKGQFDVYNSLAAVATAAAQGVSLDVCRYTLQKIDVIPGRVEVIQSQPFTVVVDYAYEPEEMRQLYETVSRWPHQNIVQVLGPTGGGRDKDRIFVLGEMAGKFANRVFITTDDPYDDDPKALADQMLEGLLASGKKLHQDVFVELDRKLAISQALRAAATNDLVLITGKGAEQKMALAKGQYLDWDDRVVVREALKNLNP